MPTKPPTHRPHARINTPVYRPPDQPKLTTAQRGYGGRWQKARATYLLKHPLCRLCQAHGRTTGATVVDHRTPHKGDQGLFWDTGNWQPLCKACHDVKTASEDGGFGNRSRRQPERI